MANPVSYLFFHLWQPVTVSPTTVSRTIVQPDASNIFLRRALPHQILGFVLERIAGDANAIDDAADTRLGDLHRRLVNDGNADDNVRSMLCFVEPRLGRTIADVLVDERTKTDVLRQRYQVLLNRTVADTTLRDYVDEARSLNDSVQKNTHEQIAQWARAAYDATLVGHALDSGDEQRARGAIDTLGARYQKQVRGFCELWCDRSDEADDIAQDAWARAWAKLDNYDPAHGSFGGMVKMHARYALRDRHRGDKRRGPNADDAGDTETELQAPVSDTFRGNDCVNTLLTIIFRPDKLPHQAIAYGFCRLLQYKPSEIVANKSDIQLKILETQFTAELIRLFELPEAETNVVVEPFRATMEKTIPDITTHGKTRAAYSQLLDRILGLTVFRDYYRSESSRDNANDLVRWWSAAHVRVLAAAAMSPDLNDCLSD